MEELLIQACTDNTLVYLTLNGPKYWEKSSDHVIPKVCELFKAEPEDPDDYYLPVIFKLTSNLHKRRFQLLQRLMMLDFVDVKDVLC